MQLRPLCTGEVAVKSHTSGGEAYAIRCKRWSCPVCCEINRRKVIEKAKEGRPRALLTLTVRHGDYASPDEAAQALKRGLRLLRLRLKRSPRLENFEFIAVYEKHKSGWPHLHLLIRGKFIPWRDLRTMWEGITGAFMVDIRRISTIGQAAAYAAKYIGKDLAAFAGCKRWWRSHGYSTAKADDYARDHPREQWDRALFGFVALADSLERAGWIVERQRGERFRWHAPPDGPTPPGWRRVMATAIPHPSPWGDG